MEEELHGAVAESLGRSADKVKIAMEDCKRWAEEARRLEAEGLGGVEEVLGRYNEARGRMERRRWELIVQRQACGFVIDNYEAIYKLFPIPDKMEVGEVRGEVRRVEGKEGKEKKAMGQLSWWQSIGRWK